MFARTAPLTAAALAVAVVLLLPAGAPAATAGVRVLSPADEGVVPAAPVRVQLAVPDVRGLRVTVDRHDITGQLRAAGGRRTVVLRGARVKPRAWCKPLSSSAVAGARKSHTSVRKALRYHG